MLVTPSCHPMPGMGEASLDLPLVFLTGITVSLGHCVGMCGPIQGAFAAGQAGRGGAGRALLGPLVRYHTARILAYALLGFVFGLAGTATRLGALSGAVQGALALTMSALMLPVALGMAGWVALPRTAWPVRAGGMLVRRMGPWLAAPGGSRQLALGLANGFLPCGPVLAMALAAGASAHALFGALLMTVYGLGTAPVLLVLGAASGRAGGRARLHPRFHVVAAVMLVLVAGQLALRGLAVLGAIPHLALGRFVFW
jgi:sulfite exporter TauE/SafE